jgi:hypothetical protein
MVHECPEVYDHRRLPMFTQGVRDSTWILASLLMAAVACSTPSAATSDANGLGDGATAVSGTVGGSAFAAQDAVFTLANAKGLAFNGQSTVAFVGDFGGICAKEQASSGVMGGRSIFIGLAVNDAAGSASPVTSPGAHVIATGAAAQGASARVAQLFYQRVGANCLKAEMHSAASGAVTVTAVDASRLDGTFDVVLADTNEHVTGAFAASSCSSFDPNRTPNATCQ